MSAGTGGTEGDAGPSSSESRPSGGTIRPKISKKFRIDVPYLKWILEMPATVAEAGGKERYPYLLLDCRSPERFANGHLKSEQCVNVPLAEEFTVPYKSSGQQGVESKAAAVKFLRELSPEVLGYLEKPGSFDRIVVVSEKDADDPPFKISWLIRAIWRWDHPCDTDVVVFQGRMEEFREENPDLVTSEASASAEEGTSDLAPSAREHLKRLDEIAALYKGLLPLHGKIESLKQVKIVLDTDERKKREVPTLEKFKCTSCSRFIFVGTIFMCAKGHNICTLCLETTYYCQGKGCNGKEPFNVHSMRENDRAQNLRASSNTYQCICKVHVEFRNMQEHLDTCVTNAIGEEMTWIDEEIGRLQARIAADKESVANLKKLVIDGDKLMFERLVRRPSEMLNSMNWSRFVNKIAEKEELNCTLKKGFFLSMM